jgi:hypothetical protein
MMKKIVWVFILMIALGVSSLAQDLNLNNGSPQIPPYTPGDILNTALGTPPPIIPFGVLALTPASNISAMSYGGERMKPHPSCKSMVYYSVTATSAGMPGSPVAIQVAGNGAAGDIFVALLDPTLGPSTGPILWKDAPVNGLLPLPIQDELDGLSYPVQPVTTPLVYFTLDPASAAFFGLTSADIVYTAPGVMYAPFGLLGLTPMDEIDALAIVDMPPIGVLGPTDTIFISLTSASPTAPPMGGGASIIRAWPGPLTPVYMPAQFGLLPTDDIDAFTFYGPNGTYACPPYVPGDINGDGSLGGGDVTYLVRFFKGIGAPPPYQCYDVSNRAMLYSAADLNGDCQLRGADVTRLVSYFKAIAVISSCPWTPPCGI